MKNKHFATYPIAFINNLSDRAERIFDNKSRDSYFKSLEVAQKNLSLAFKGKG